jgi:hypothetical protein
VTQAVLRALALALPLAAACRFGFEHTPTDAASDGPPDAHLPVLSCGAPPQFSLGGTACACGSPGLAAAATDTEYYAFVIDSVGVVHGFSYGFDGGQLAPRKTDVEMFTGATVKGGAAAATQVGDQVMLSTLYGQPDALGIALVGCDSDLGALADAQMHAGWLGLDGTIARAHDGTLAFLGAQSNFEVDGKLVTPTGGDVGVPHTLIDRNEKTVSQAITAAENGFLVTWSAGLPDPNEVRAALLDSSLAVTVPSTTINPLTSFDGNEPRAAYAPSVGRYLFAWWFKSPADEVWVSLRDQRLTEITAVRLSTHGKTPRVIAGDSDFLVVWTDDGVPSGLAAARVNFNGGYSSLMVPGSSMALGWDLVTRAGQPALVWLENSVPPTLRLNPLCN